MAGQWPLDALVDRMAADLEAAKPKGPSPLKVARAERDAARSEANLLSRVLHDLAAGRQPDAVESASREDGWTVKATLYRCQSGEGGLLLIQEHDSDGKPTDTRAAYFEAWRDAVNAHPSEYNIAERIVAERIGAARWRIWDGKADPDALAPTGA